LRYDANTKENRKEEISAERGKVIEGRLIGQTAGFECTFVRWDGNITVRHRIDRHDEVCRRLFVKARERESQGKGIDVYEYAERLKTAAE
jgi:hypothetical protein